MKIISSKTSIIGVTIILFLTLANFPNISYQMNPTLNTLSISNQSAIQLNKNKNKSLIRFKSLNQNSKKTQSSLSESVKANSSNKSNESLNNNIVKVSLFLILEIKI
jgi:hypothetical protein